MPPHQRPSVVAPPPSDDTEVKPSLDSLNIATKETAPTLLGDRKRRTRSSTGSLPAKIKADVKDESDAELDGEKPPKKKARSGRDIQGARNMRMGVSKSRGIERKAEAESDEVDSKSDIKVDIKPAISEFQIASSSRLVPIHDKAQSEFSPPTNYNPAPAFSATSSSIKPEQNNKPEKKPKIGKIPKVPPKTAEDFRSGQFRKKCPVATEDRAQRVMDQRMYMIHRSGEQDLQEEFKVLGSTGNVYTINYSHNPRCDCPDFLKGNSPCKHLLFVSLKVLHIPRFPPGRTLSEPDPDPNAVQSATANIELHLTWYQKTLSTNELRAIFENARVRVGPGAARLAGISVDERTRKVWARHHLGIDGDKGEVSGLDGRENEHEQEKMGKPGEKMDDGRRLPDVGDDCPICYDELVLDGKGQESLVYHLGLSGCGKALHQQCYAMWAATEAKVGNGHKVSCVYCRSAWMVGGGDGLGVDGNNGIGYSGGYTNLADLAGMNRERDMSSYYMGPKRGVKYRPWQYYQD